METNFSHQTFISPFSWRYGSEEMRSIWSEHRKRTLLRRVWIALAKAQCKAGLVSQAQVDDLYAHKDDIDIPRSLEIEKTIRHDLMAEIKTYAEQCPIGGSIIHLGATSMDALDNMDVIRQKEALAIILKHVKAVAESFIEKIVAFSDTPCMAFTHIQPAEITTVGYRLAQTAQDLLQDITNLTTIYSSLRGKGMKGAVGSSASYTVLLQGSGMDAREMERLVMDELDLGAFEAATQVYPRKQDWQLGAALAGLAQTLYKFAIDVRLLQSPAIGEWSEPFGEKQVGSSAMPFKRNPIESEKIDSLCRFVVSQCDVLWQNAAHSFLERTLDDSANRRVVLPEMFMAIEEALMCTSHIVSQMRIHRAQIERNLKTWGVFASSERLLMELGRNGADRQHMHEVIRQHSLIAWEAVQQGKENPLIEMLSHDTEILEYLNVHQILLSMYTEDYVGDAPQRARHVSQMLQESIKHIPSTIPQNNLRR